MRTLREALLVLGLMPCLVTLASTPNPHGDSTQCGACHRVIDDQEKPLGPVAMDPALCIECHDGQRAAREAHPVAILPSSEMIERIPPEFPLRAGRLTCLTCHDVNAQCTSSPGDRDVSPDLLRGELREPAAFCFQCHDQGQDGRFNVHDQIRDGQVLEETCLWCHVGVPDTDARGSDSRAAKTLRTSSFGVCHNCHLMPKGHPLGHDHMFARPSAEMKTYMVAVEMQSTMRLPFEKLLQYAQSSKRPPRVVPLDERGRITCFTCHDPHEEGVLPRRYGVDAVAAGRTQAHRFRNDSDHGSLCRACHAR